MDWGRRGWVGITMEFLAELEKMGLFATGVTLRLLRLAEFEDGKAWHRGRYVPAKAGEIVAPLTGPEILGPVFSREDRHGNKLRKLIGELAKRGIIEVRVHARKYKISFLNYKEITRGDFSQHAIRTLPEGEENGCATKDSIYRSRSRSFSPAAAASGKKYRVAEELRQGDADLEIEIEDVPELVQRRWLAEHSDLGANWVRTKLREAFTVWLSKTKKAQARTTFAEHATKWLANGAGRVREPAAKAASAASGEELVALTDMFHEGKAVRCTRAEAEKNGWAFEPLN